MVHFLVTINLDFFLSLCIILEKTNYTWNNLTSFFTLKFISILVTNAIWFRFTPFYIAVKEELEYVLPFTLVFKTIVCMLFCGYIKCI